MLILAPSYKRAGGLLTHHILPSTIYCVHSFEAEEYRARGVEVLEMPDEIRGNIARVRNWLVDWAVGQGETEILLLDDDIARFGCFYRTTGADALMGDAAEDKVEHCFRVAEEWGVALWGVNCVSDKGGYREYTPFSNKSYCTASFHGLRLNSLGAIRYDERLPLKEDYDICLQVLNRDRKLLRFNFLHLLKDDHGNQGGCAMYRNLDKERQQMDLLISKWGDSIVRVDKTSKELLDINPVMRAPIGGV